MLAWLDCRLGSLFRHTWMQITVRGVIQKESGLLELCSLSVVAMIHFSPQSETLPTYHLIAACFDAHLSVAGNKHEGQTLIITRQNDDCCKQTTPILRRKKSHESHALTISEFKKLLKYYI